VNPETFAVCKSDLFMKSEDGRDARRMLFGSTLSNDRHAGAGFDYLIANPPYGKDWKRDQDAVRAEHDRGAAGRFGPGLPRISDGQLLFLQHMLAHVKEPAQGGSRVAIIMNGSPLFTGDAGSGESEIRRWILENDLLEALIALPEQLFYNTGIATYVWVLTNRKRPERRGKVQLIDATSFWVLLRKSLDAKRREVPFERKQDVLRLLADFEDGTTRRVERDGEERETVVSRAGRRGRDRRLRDQLQPLLPRVPPAPSAGGDRGRHPAGGEGDRGHVAGDDGVIRGVAERPVRGLHLVLKEVVDMPLSDRIKPISYLKAHAAEIIRTLADQPEPLIVTQNGEAKAVVQDIDSYEQMQESMALLKMLALGNRQIDAGRVQPAAEVIARLRERHRAD